MMVALKYFLWGLAVSVGLVTLMVQAGPAVYFTVTFYLIPALLGLIFGLKARLDELHAMIETVKEPTDENPVE